ncbi:MAG: hypothetical protein GX591_20155 [Planctomycetes bacterium]|nr:hypothetical protein [Planctomycetota bacterium]
MIHRRQRLFRRELVVAVLLGALGGARGEERSAPAQAEALEDQGLVALLTRTAALGDEDRLLQEAAFAGVEAILADPEAHRDGPVAMNVVVWRVTALTPEAARRSHIGYAPGCPIWRVDCTQRRPDRYRNGDPLIVLVSDLPERLTETEYPAGMKATVYGLLHKVVTLQTERPEQAAAAARAYPVLVARTLYGVGAAPGRWGKAVLGVGLVVLGIGFVLARRAARRAARWTGEGVNR